MTDLEEQQRIAIWDKALCNKQKAVKFGQFFWRQDSQNLISKTAVSRRCAHEGLFPSKKAIYWAWCTTERTPITFAIEEMKEPMSLADVGDIIVKLQRLVAQKAVDEIEAYLSPEHKTVPGTESKSNVATGIPVDGGPVGSDLLLGRSVQAPDPDRQPLPMEEGGGVDEMQLQDEDDGDYPQYGGFGGEELDKEKLDRLEELFPDGTFSVSPLLQPWEKKKIMRKIPYFPEGFIPPALKDDLSGLSASLSPAEKETVRILFHCQERERDLLRMQLFYMYEQLDPKLPLSEQNAAFRKYHHIFVLTRDNFLFFIKKQQEVILNKRGLASVLKAKNRSIIPPEMETELKKTADFQDVFHKNQHRFSGRGGRRGGSRSPGRWSHRGRGRGFGRGRGQNSGFYGSHRRWDDQNDGYRSGGDRGPKNFPKSNGFSGRGRGGSGRGERS